MEQIMSIIGPYLPYVAYALPFIFGLIALAVRGELKGYARETVAAVYRVAIHSASVLEDEGIAWLKSDAGIAYRRHLSELAYDSLPATIRGVPVGMVKMLINRDRWCELVEEAFQAAVSVAEKLELPDELPTA